MTDQKSIKSTVFEKEPINDFEKSVPTNENYLTVNIKIIGFLNEEERSKGV